MWSELDPENVMNAIKGWFPLSRNFQVPTQVNFTRVNKIERGSTLTFTPDFPYIAFILFTHLKFALRKKHATVEIHPKTPVDS